MNSGFKDHFSGHASDYALYRPGYPEALYDWLADVVPARRLAWDCATGNGQAALALASRFERVYASDASEEQIGHARRASNVVYAVEPAERSGLDDRAVDLVTVAQAYHWFDHEAFIGECERVVRPGGVLAVWTYALARIEPGVDRLVEDFYRETVGPYWPPERRLVESGYRTLVFPWPELRPPPLAMELEWNLSHFEGYLRTWSATRRFQAERGVDPVDGLHSALAEAWGAPPAAVRPVRWPIELRAFRLS